MKLADLSPRLRRERVTVALEFTLRGLTAPADTTEIVAAVAEHLASSELEIISRIVLSLAPGYPQAQKSSAVWRKYGREFHRWVWSPERKQLDSDPLVRCPTCNSRQFPTAIADDHCPECIWSV